MRILTEKLILFSGLGKKADYVVTGFWSKRAADEAAKFMDVNVPMNLLETGALSIPPVSEW